MIDVGMNSGMFDKNVSVFVREWNRNQESQFDSNDSPSGVKITSWGFFYATQIENQVNR